MGELQVWHKDISAARNMLELVLAGANGQPRPLPFSWAQGEEEEVLDVAEAAAEDAAAPGKEVPIVTP